MPKCPMSEMAVHSLKQLSESYNTLVQTAVTLSAQDVVSERQKKRAFRRAERTGQVIDNLLANWELGTCPAVFHCCSWEQCQRELEIISALTPCNQFCSPLFNSTNNNSSSNNNNSSSDDD